MFNVDFLPRLERFRNFLWGGRKDVLTTPLNYIKMIPCEQNEHGEWVPVATDADTEGK